MLTDVSKGKLKYDKETTVDELCEEAENLKQ